MSINNDIDDVLSNVENIERCEENLVEDFDDLEDVINMEVFMEADDTSSLNSWMIVFIEHFYKICYCDNISELFHYQKEWFRSINHSINSIVHVLKKGKARKKKYHTNKYNSLIENMEENYSHGVSAYKRAVKKMNSLENGLDYIPKENPWELNDILEKRFTKLLTMFPNRAKIGISEEAKNNMLEEDPTDTAFEYFDI